ncbi:hypothetical protein V1290_001238 [Bradyrhizobium sp. AZCC 1578]
MFRFTNPREIILVRGGPVPYRSKPKIKKTKRSP